MGKIEKKCIQLADKIERFFQQGIAVSDDVLHFIDSTFSHPTVPELNGICEDESNCERDSFINLIISPDEPFQIQIEKMLIDEVFEEQYIVNVTDLLCSRETEAQIVFPDGRGNLKVAIPNEAITSFVSQLNIDWKPDEKVMGTLDRLAEIYLNESNGLNREKQFEYLKTAVTVRMRNKKADHSEKKTNVLCVFLERADTRGPSFFHCFDFLLDMMEGFKDTEDIYEAISQRKQQYCQYITKRKTFDSMLQKNNPEMMALKGVNTSFINMDDMQKKMACIDRITLAVYGEIVYCYSY